MGPLLLPPNSSLNSTFLVLTILELQFKINFNLFNKATPEVVEDDQVVIMGETEDGQTILIPTPGNANAPTIVNLDADLGSGTNTVIVDADSLSSTHGRTGSSYHGGKTIKVDSKFLNKLLSQRFGQAGNY